MKLDDVLKTAPGTRGASDHASVYFHGVIEADSDSDYFRLYRRPENRHSYLLVRKADVAGDVLERFSPEEAAHAGFVGSTIHRFPLRIGTEVQGVSIKFHNVGDPFPKKTKSSKDQVCCCDNCIDINTCGTTDSATCDQIGEVCDDSDCS